MDTLIRWMFEGMHALVMACLPVSTLESTPVMHMVVLSWVLCIALISMVLTRVIDHYLDTL